VKVEMDIIEEFALLVADQAPEEPAALLVQ
jgi:hypothetical protein